MNYAQLAAMYANIAIVAGLIAILMSIIGIILLVLIRRSLKRLGMFSDIIAGQAAKIDKLQTPQQPWDKSK